MNLDPLSFCLTQISQLVEALTKKNLKQSSQELTQLVSLHGLEADKQLVKCLVKEAVRGFWETGRSGAGGVHASLLAQQLGTLLNHPIRVPILCHAIDRPLPTNLKVNKSSVAPFSQLFRVLKLTTVQEVAFCLALRKSKNSDVALLAHQHLKKRLLDLIQCYLDTDTGRQAEGGGLQDCSPEILQLILVSLIHENFGLASITKELFLKRLRREFPREQVPVILSPLLYPDDSEYPLEEMTSSDDMAGSLMKNSLADLVREMGFSFTASIEDCKNNILNLGGRDVTAGDIARVISMMAKNHSGLLDGPPLQTPGNLWYDIKNDTSAHRPQDTWNVEVFIQAVKELFPNLNWKEVIYQLDHPEFLIKDRAGLCLLFSALQLGLQAYSCVPTNVFPVEYIYRHWNNTEGQMSLLSHILKNSDVFSFSDHLYSPVTIDILKSLPEIDNKDVANWQSIYLVELLLYLSDRGFYIPVLELFKSPIQNCPDVLMLGLLQINMPGSLLRQELLSSLIPVFLGNHPNSAIILQHAWHAQNPSIKPTIMHAMADWYLRGEHDQQKLSRILDVAQDLKALSHLLNVQSFSFVIDLACLASRREYLKLDKWLTDKIREHGETFILNMVKFLQRRCPQVISGKISDEQMPKVTQLPQETIATMLTCLNICVNNVQQELSEMIVAVTNNCTMLLNKTRPALTAGPRPHRVLEPTFNPTGLGGGQIFNNPPVDPISALGPNLANMSIGGTGTSSFAVGPLVTTPGSPSRLMAGGPSNSPFAMMPFQHGANAPNMVLVNRSNANATAVDKRINDNQTLFPEIVQYVTKEIEDEANGYFQRIYNHPPHPTLSIDEVLDMLKKFSDSSNKREREVYSCMLRNLFEEYKFFPQYPEKELHITAQLFGGIIEKGLVTSYMALGLALKFVLEALRKPHGSKMFYFGAAALDRFKSRLKDYHKYCEHIRTIEHFFEFPPHLIEYVEYGLQMQEPPTKPQGPIFSTTSFVAPTTLIPSGTSTSLYKASVSTISSSVCFTTKMSSTHTNSRPSIANATNIDTLLVATDREEKITIPPDSVQDKVAFIFNNLSQLNLQTKCDELRDIIGDDYWPWLSQYLVMKRASIELNFHVLYSNFLDVLKVKELCKMVTKETFRNIGVLLRSDKGIANFSDRSLLKNLGHWLGMLTLGRNKPILHVDLDLKGLILEAFHKGQQELLYVVPFVAKVIESCSKSKVFKPPNPWTMSIMNVLAELHQEPDLKLNLKFEIEVLCKNLNVDVSNLKPASYLKDEDNLQKIQNQLSNPSKKDSTSTPISQTMGTPIPSAVVPSAALVPPDEVSGISVTPTSGIIPGEPGMLPIAGHPEPRFSYLELSISNMSQFSQYISINPHLVLFQNYPHLKQFVKTAIERSIQEWIHPVVERSIKYALPACEHIIRKDFALDPEESRMRTSAHHIMRHVTAGLAMTNCREQLLKAINQNLITSFLNVSISVTSQHKEIMESAAAILASENMELVCAFIQKTSAEKGLPELDKRLMNDYELRKSARQENRRYYDSAVLTYHERMPERIKLKVGVVSDSQMTVYEEFARNIPGFAPIKERSTPLMVPKPVPQNPLPLPPLAFNQGVNNNQNIYYGTDELTRLIIDTEFVLENMLSVPNFALQLRNMHTLLDTLYFVRRSQEMLTAFSLLQKAIEGLLEGLTIVGGGASSEQVEAMTRYKEIHIRALRLLQDSMLGQIWTSKQVTLYLTECRDELKFANLDAVDALIRANLVNIQQYDLALAQCMDNGSNYMAVTFAMQFVQLYLVNEKDSILMTESDLVNTIEVLVRIASHSRPVPDGLASLVKLLRVEPDVTNVLGDRPQIAPLSHMHTGAAFHARVRDDPHGLTEKTEYLVGEWANLYHNPPPNREMMKTFNMFVQQMNASGILKTDETVTQFFRIATQFCIDNVYQVINEERSNPPESIQRNKFYRMPDAYVRLITLLIKNSGDAGNTVPKINLLNKILTITAGCLIQDHKERNTSFQQLPYYRILIMLFLDLNESEPVLEAINFQLLTAYCHTLHMIQPIVAPGFIYAWLDFVAHRAFIHRMLASTPQQKGWGMYSQLLVDLFKYIKPFLTNTALAKPISLLYNGILKVLLVLLHDFPEFLCDYHYIFCDEISPNCIQMRNLILSAFPRNMRLPDPFTPNLKFDLLPEITHAPRILANYIGSIQPLNFRKDLDSYLEARAPVTFLSELRSIMQISNEPGKKYNVPLMNAVILYVGTQAITYIRSKGQTPSMSTIAHTAHMDIFQNLAVDLDYEGRYIFLNGIGNQLRFPNSHTHYFSCALLYLFAEANSEAIQEQITRMLLERIIVNRPHPWGLLITFIELVKNPTYKFADHDFVHCAPEIERLCTKENIQAIYAAKETNDNRK